MTDESRRDLDSAIQHRRPYEPPEVLDESDFETLALSCGKQSGIDCYEDGGYSAS